MKKITKTFVIGALTGALVMSIAYEGVSAIQKTISPTDEFIGAKYIVATQCDASVNDISLYRHEGDSKIWKEVIDTNILGSENGIYPNYVYTSNVNGNEEILAVVIALRNKETINDLRICGHPIQDFSIEMSYETDRFEPVYVAKINISGMKSIDNVMHGVDSQLKM